jgi:Zn-dependent M28 family amino/carboxypeptidase
MTEKIIRQSLCLCASVVVLAAADGHRWWSYVQVLADDKMEGRNTGSEGHRKAAAFVATEFERAGLKPAGTSGYMQPVKFRSRRIVEEQCSLALVRDGATQPLALGEDAIISSRVDAADSVEAPLVFVGYGLAVPELKYDDFAGLDLRGKIAMYLSGGPSSIPGNLRAHYQSAGERWKALRRVGAIGAVSVQNPRHMDIPWARSSLARFQPSMSLTDAALDDTAGQKISAIVNPAHADKFLKGSGHSFSELLALAGAGKPLPRFPLPAQLKAKVRLERTEVESQNVIGVLPGTDLRNEYVVLSAHLDHVGIGRPIHGDSIYNGAMDNASGVAALLDIAHALHESKKSPRRSLLFLVVTGEEKGLQGSKYFAAHPTVDSKSIVANLNVDMFLPLFPLRILTVYGLNESDLGDEARSVATSMGIGVQDDPEPNRNVFIRSDQYNFIRKGVPALAFKVGFEKGSPEAATAKKWLTERYHAPSDDLQQPVDLGAAGKFNEVILRLTERVANRAERPRWKANSFFRRFAG